MMILHRKLGKVPKEYADAEGLLYRQICKLLRKFALLHAKQLTPKRCCQFRLAIKCKLKHIEQVVPDHPFRQKLKDVLEL